MPPTAHIVNVGSRSVFVNAVAWAVLGLAALAALSALLHAPALGPRPWLAAAGVALAALLAAAAIGLLRRLDWARRAVIVLLGLALVAQLPALWLQQEVMVALVHETLSRAVLPAPVLAVFGGFVAAARVMAGLLTLGAGVLLALAMRRLMTDAVRREFG